MNLTTPELLKAVQHALNTIPRKSLPGCPHGIKDSYQLASLIDEAVKRPDETTEAACCLWEAVLAVRQCEKNPPWQKRLLADWESHGTSSMRISAIHAAPQMDQVWNALTDAERDEFGCFDWDFVPVYLACVLYHETNPGMGRDEALTIMRARLHER
jgi:hypothetical protein